MNQDINQPQPPVTPIQVPPPIQTPQPITNTSVLGKYTDKIKPILLNVFSGFYKNKKVFWPVSISCGLILLVIILGVLFGKKGPTQNVVKLATPTPIVRSTPQASSSGNVIIDSQNKLNDLKNQINNLDVNQSRLTPPTLNFNISF